ncbi:hypothetical protein ACN28E_28345 [Archangium lansingense]|uniref:hypothetical protein n=1 Tax=Archangium lansingense TaxID=2995310 RepID=UPI003B78D1B9
MKKIGLPSISTSSRSSSPTSPTPSPKAASPKTTPPSTRSSAPSTPGKLTEAQKQPLEAHIGKKKEEQKILGDKWNTNGQGRNQGLVHLLDYAYARPNKIDTTPPSTKLTDAEKSKLAQGDKAGWDGARWKEELGEKRFTELNDKGYFRKFQTEEGKHFGPNGAKLNDLSAQHQGAKQKLDDTNKKLSEERNQLKSKLEAENVPKKDIGNQMKEFNKTNATAKEAEKQKKVYQDLEKELANGRRYVLESDTSKKGRLGQIENSAQLPPGSLKGNEIKGGTEAVEKVMAEAKQNGNGPKLSENKPTKDMTSYDKIGPGQWKEQTTKVEDLKPTHSSDQTAGGLNVKKWGVTENDLKLSTVMGAGGEK